MIKFDKLFVKLNEKGVNKHWLRQNNINSATVNKLTKNQTVTTLIIDRLCTLLDCQPGDIMEHTDDN